MHLCQKVMYLRKKGLRNKQIVCIRGKKSFSLFNMQPNADVIIISIDSKCKIRNTVTASLWLRGVNTITTKALFFAPCGLTGEQEEDITQQKTDLLIGLNWNSRTNGEKLHVLITPILRSTKTTSQMHQELWDSPATSKNSHFGISSSI